MDVLLAIQAAVPVTAPPIEAWTPTSVGSLVTLIGAAIVTVIGAWKLAKIEAHVNSEKTALHEQAVAKDKEVLLLREMLDDRKITAALLAQQVATRPDPVPTAASPVLAQIETNTDATAKNTAKTEKNTAKTDAAVTKLKEAL